MLRCIFPLLVQKRLFLHPFEKVPWKFAQCPTPLQPQELRSPPPPLWLRLTRSTLAASDSRTIFSRSPSARLIWACLLSFRFVDLRLANPFRFQNPSPFLPLSCHLQLHGISYLFRNFYVLDFVANATDAPGKRGLIDGDNDLSVDGLSFFKRLVQRKCSNPRNARLSCTSCVRAWRGSFTP